jgi:YVTN family beta-propeller protein
METGMLKSPASWIESEVMVSRHAIHSTRALVLLVALVLATAALPFAHGQALVGSVNVGGTSYGVAYDSGKGEVFVTHFFNDSITVLSDSNNAVVTTIHLAQNYEPVGLAYDSAKGEIFVANYGANTVSIISDATDKAIMNVSVGPYPEAVAYDSAKGEIFVAAGTSRTEGTVTVISDATNTVLATLPVGNFPRGLAYDSAKGEVFVANYGANTVSVISDSNNSVDATPINVGVGPSDLAYDAAKGEVFVTNYGGNTVSVIDDSTGKVTAAVNGLLGPNGIAYDSGKGEVFVADEGNISESTTDVSVISDSTDKVTANVDTGASNTVLAYDSAKGLVFVGGNGDFIVNVISDSAAATSTSASTKSTSASTSATSSSSQCFSPGSIGSQLSVSCTTFTYNTGTEPGGPGAVGVGLDPIGLAYDSARGVVFVAEFSAPAVSAISDSTNSVISTVEVPGLNNPGFHESPSPQYLAYDAAKGELFVSNLYGNCLTVISDVTNSVVTTIDLGNDSVNNGIGGYPVNMAYDSAKGEIFVVEQGATTISGSYDASAGFVSVVSDTTNSVVATIPLGDFPSAIAYDPAKGELFVANDGKTPSDTSASNTATGIVSVISDTTNSAVSTVTVGPFPDGIAYDPAKGELFVASSGSTTTAGSVSVISDATNAIVATLPLADAGAVAYDPAKGELFVVTPNSNSTSIISDATNAVVGTRSAGPGPFDIAYDSAKGELFVSNPASDTVTIISDATTTSTTTSTMTPTLTSTTTTSATSSSTHASSSSLPISYLAIVAVDGAVIGILGALAAARGRTRRNVLD